MTKTLAVTFGSLILIGSSALFSVSSQAADFVRGELLVKYRDGVRRDRVSMNAFYSANSIGSVYRFTGVMEGLERVRFDASRPMADALRQVLQDPLVEYATPNYVVKIQPVNFPKPMTKPCNSIFGCAIGQLGDGWPSKPTPGPTPPPGEDKRPAVKPAPALVDPPVADPRAAELYGMQKIQAIAAQNAAKGGVKVIVADIDTGIDYNHEDIGGSLWRNGSNAKGDVVGYDFVHDDELPFDDNMHGTHTAGTIGAMGSNGAGVYGVSNNVQLMALKFLSDSGSGTLDGAIRAIDFAISHGAKILSNSWGGGGGGDDMKALSEAVTRAQAKGVLFIAAAGNESSDNDGSSPSYPAAFKQDNMITVAATDKNDKLAYFSNYGKTTTHLAAPGVKILSTVPGNAYKELDGTSMACPHVAGAAALVWSKYPNYTYKQVKAALLDSVDKLPELESKTVTGGRLNVAAALK